MDNSEQLGYFSKTVAEKLSVSTHSIRSWSIKLEDKGIEFERNDKKQRIYYEKDIQLFRDMKELLDLQQPMNKVLDIMVEKAEKGDYDAVQTENHTSITPSVIRENKEGITQWPPSEQQYNQLAQAFTKVTEEYESTKQKMYQIEKNTERMASSMEEMLKEVRREKREKELFQEKLEIAVEFIQKIEETAAHKEEKKGFFERLFGR
ncbi:MerR family transcriptional regulator (plasmid) [Priestia megaterium]|uniref:MerR family transcriptional regulator n=1 Tax=Priestia megaterium TaxID=1404 RepID=UPI0030CEC284